MYPYILKEQVNPQPASAGSGVCWLSWLIISLSSVRCYNQQTDLFYSLCILRFSQVPWYLRWASHSASSVSTQQMPSKRNLGKGKHRNVCVTAQHRTLGKGRADATIARSGHWRKFTFLGAGPKELWWSWKGRLWGAVSGKGEPPPTLLACHPVTVRTQGPPAG